MHNVVKQGTIGMSEDPIEDLGRCERCSMHVLREGDQLLHGYAVHGEASFFGVQIQANTEFVTFEGAYFGHDPQRNLLASAIAKALEDEPQPVRTESMAVADDENENYVIRSIVDEVREDIEEGNVYIDRTVMWEE